MTMTVSRGGLLVAMAVFGVIVYEIRTVLEAVGVSVPLVPYLVVVVILSVLIVALAGLFGLIKTDANREHPT